MASTPIPPLRRHIQALQQNRQCSIVVDTRLARRPSPSLYGDGVGSGFLGSDDRTVIAVELIPQGLPTADIVTLVRLLDEATKAPDMGYELTIKSSGYA